MIVDESHVTIPQLGGMYRGDRARKETLVDFGFRLPSAWTTGRCASTSSKRKMRRCIFVSATPSGYELEHSSQVVEQVVRPTGLIDPTVIVRPARTQVDDVLSEIKLRTDKHERVLITTLTKRMAEDLTSSCRSTASRSATCTRTSTRSNGSRSSATCARACSTSSSHQPAARRPGPARSVAGRDPRRRQGGFLRSDRSLIQTIGRAGAPRERHRDHVRGIRSPASMRRALDETDRRARSRRRSTRCTASCRAA